MRYPNITVLREEKTFVLGKVQMYFTFSGSISSVSSEGRAGCPCAAILRGNAAASPLVMILYRLLYLYNITIYAILQNKVFVANTIEEQKIKAFDSHSSLI